MTAQTIQSAMALSTVTFTRPANTTAYGTGKTIGTSGASAFAIDLTFNPTGTSSPPQYDGRSLLANLNVFAGAATTFDFDLFAFSASPSFIAQVDQATWAPTTADAALLVGSKSFTGATDGKSYGASGSIYVAQNLGWVIPVLPAVTPQIWVALIARATFTPASGEVFRITIGALT